MQDGARDFAAFCKANRSAQGLPKNGSVPFFDRIRKTSTGERFRPTLAAINNSRPNMTSNGDVRKSLHLRLSKSSLAGRANNNAEDMWSKTDVSECVPGTGPNGWRCPSLLLIYRTNYVYFNVCFSSDLI